MKSCVRILLLLAVIYAATPVDSGADAGRNTAIEPRQPGRPVVVRVDGGGFDWGDAAIGAAAAAGLILLALSARTPSEPPRHG
jgi:hypothetical protein